jgi:DNA-binding NtrC family response regulator
MVRRRRRQAVERPYRPGYLRVVQPPSPVGATARCLVVDDDAQVRHAIARIIEGHGLATIEAESGAEALALLQREGEIPLVISDIQMPEMDGIAFLR